MHLISCPHPSQTSQVMFPGRQTLQWKLGYRESVRQFSQKPNTCRGVKQSGKEQEGYMDCNMVTRKPGGISWSALKLGCSRLVLPWGKGRRTLYITQTTQIHRRHMSLWGVCCQYSAPKEWILNSEGEDMMSHFSNQCTPTYTQTYIHIPSLVFCSFNTLEDWEIGKLYSSTNSTAKLFYWDQVS